MEIDYAKEGKEARQTIIEMVIAAQRGHVGSAFSLIEILLVLYKGGILKVDPKNPHWPERDRMILSKGHGCLALYPILCDLGFFPREELMLYCRPKGILGGHPEHLKVPGVEASTGALGHGLSIGIGMALAARMNGHKHRVFVILGDGECDEGSIWEGALHASKHALDSLTVLVDYNRQQSYSDVSEVLPLEPFAEKWRAFGFSVDEVDMDHPDRLHALLLKPVAGRPRVVICHTVKGKGVSFIERNLQWHHKAKLTELEIENIFNELEI
ncbi:MAG: transketolase [Planctomycetota bacterium]|nr:transketolase [Planctomycetota bacterium]